MDRSELVARLKVRFRDPGEAIVTASQWVDYLNEAYGDVWAASPYWPFRESAASGTLAYTVGLRVKDLPAGATRLTSVRNATDGILMRPFDDRNSQVVLDPELDDTGTPQWYRVFGNQLLVYPLPAVATNVAIEYWAAITTLDADTDVPAFPAHFHHVLVAGALARAYEDDGQMDQAQLHKGRFDEIVQAMRVELLSANQDRYPTIMDTFFD